jgi:aspartyl-tRNA(Asn)/glutamyl-tRNA(Gln) amidotransferase subunit A
VLPTEEAPTVLRLREVGVVFLGATTTPEFGWKGGGDSPLTGITRNPWDLARTTGGSSAGAGAAAASGMGVLHVGTDGGGSVRMPSAFCGVVGLKPTHAIVPIHPAAVSGMLSHVGPMARTVRDTAHLMSAIARPDGRDVHPSLRDDRSWLHGIDDGVAGLRIAYAPRFARADVDPRIAAAVDAAVEVLAGLGARVDAIEAPLPDVRDAFLTLWDAALGRMLRAMSDEQLAMSDPGLVATTRRRAQITADDYLDADAVRGALTAQLSELLTTYDLLVSPQLPVLAFPVGQDVADPATQEHWVDWTPFTYPINMTRHPAVSVPIGLSDTGLPMAMQIVGRHFDDRLVLRAARAYEQVHPVVLRRY